MREPPPDTLLFGELRSLLHQSPSPGLWDALCHALEPWETSPNREDVLGYAESLLSRWPARYRRPPRRWIARQLSSTHTSPFWLWHLVRALDLDDCTPYTPAHITASLLSPLTHLSMTGASAHLFLHRFAQLSSRSPLTHLCIERWPLSPGRLMEIFQAMRLPHLHTLRLTHSRQTTSSIHTLCQLPWMHHLCVLDLSYNLLDDRALDPILSSPPPRLEHLDLAGNKLTAQGMRRLLKHPFTRQLYTLSLGENLDLSPGVRAKLLDAQATPR